MSDEYVMLAKATVEIYVKKGKIPEIKGGCVICDDPDFKGEHLSKEIINNKAGTFVSIHKKTGKEGEPQEGYLRGCIGTICATRSTVAEEIVHNAISASTQDPRFPPVSPEELNSLIYSVDVLGPIEDISSSKELDIKRYGVIVTKGYRRGLLLPNLDGVDSIEQQIDIACRKGGITLDENPQLQRFEVVRHV